MGVMAKGTDNEEKPTSSAKSARSKQIKSKLSICAIVLSLINLLLWFIALVYMVTTDRSLDKRIYQSYTRQQMTASAQKQHPTFSEIQSLIDTSIVNYGRVTKEEWQKSMDVMRAEMSGNTNTLAAKIQDVKENYDRFKIFWNELAHKVVREENSTSILDLLNSRQAVLTIPLSDIRTEQIHALGAEDEGEGSGESEVYASGEEEDGGDGREVTDDTLPLPEEIISILACRQGEKGVRGDAGEIGLKGEPGITGISGAQGIQGQKGATGLQGMTGINGIPGLKGATGFPGSKGDRGKGGRPGVDGSNGDKGIPGMTGLIGLKGETGEQGAAGMAGVRGGKGEPGLPGAPGVNGIKGARGDKGDKGFDGLPGLPGLDGGQGEMGEQGAPGANGTQGEKGESGEAAELQKIPGHPGYTTDEIFSLEAIGMVVNSTTEAMFLALAKSGIRGAPGLDGRDGYNGTDGINGHDGIDGSNGIPGSNGVDGIPGINGTDGIPGIDGINGKDMTSGLTVYGMQQMIYKYHDTSDFTYGQSFYKFHSTPKTWSEAMRTCMSTGAHLVTFETKLELSEMKRLLKESMGTEIPVNLWIGARRVNGQFFWVYSTDTAQPHNVGPKVPLDTAYWVKDEPNNFQNEEFCAEIKYRTKMNDIGCGPKRPFVCEMS